MSNQEGPWGGNVKESPWENAEKSPRKPKIIDFEPIKKNNGIDFKVSWLIGALLLVWLASGFYQIQPNEEGVVLRFGKYIDTTGAGLHYHLPFPIEAVKKVNITQERSITIGDSNAYNTSNIAALSNSRNTANNTASALSSFTESHMLTGDENIVDVNLTIVWKIKSAKDYLFGMQSPDRTVQVAAQSVLREIVGQSKMQPISGKPQKLHFTRIQRLETWLGAMQLFHSLLWRTLLPFPTTADSNLFDCDEQCERGARLGLKTSARKQQDAGSENRIRRGT